MRPHIALAFEGSEWCAGAVSYTHLRAHETRHDLVCRLLLEKKTTRQAENTNAVFMKSNPEFIIEKKYTV